MCPCTVRSLGKVDLTSFIHRVGTVYLEVPVRVLVPPEGYEIIDVVTLYKHVVSIIY